MNSKSMKILAAVDESHRDLVVDLALAAFTTSPMYAGLVEYNTDNVQVMTSTPVMTLADDTAKPAVY